MGQRRKKKVSVSIPENGDGAKQVEHGGFTFGSAKGAASLRSPDVVTARNTMSPSVSLEFIASLSAPLAQLSELKHLSLRRTNTALPDPKNTLSSLRLRIRSTGGGVPRSGQEAAPAKDPR